MGRIDDAFTVLEQGLKYIPDSNLLNEILKTLKDEINLLDEDLPEWYKGCALAHGNV